MFMAADRQPKMRAMIMAADEQGRRAALDELLPLQQDDFEGLFRAMDGRPVVIRLLDPPLHEFMANPLELQEQGDRGSVGSRPVAPGDEPDARNARRSARDRPSRDLRDAGPGDRARGKSGRRRVDRRDHDPAGRLRGRAAARARARAGGRRGGGAARVQRGNDDRVAARMPDRRPDSAARGLLLFGTNDLTQAGIGFSRDDVEKEIIPRYIDEKILTASPFATLDAVGIGELVRIGVERGRGARPSLAWGSAASTVATRTRSGSSMRRAWTKSAARRSGCRSLGSRRRRPRSRRPGPVSACRRGALAGGGAPGERATACGPRPDRRRAAACAGPRTSRRAGSRRDAAAAVNLNRAIDDPQADLGDGELDPGDLDPGVLVADRVHQPRRLHHQQPGHLEVDPALGDPVADVPVVRDRVPNASRSSARSHISSSARSATPIARCSGGSAPARAAPGRS